VRAAANFCALFFWAAASLAAEPTWVSAPRLLTLPDVGKVFVKIDAEPHPNFGEYLVLTSVDSHYGFDTFELKSGNATGKLHVSYSASATFREVRIDRAAMNGIWTAIRMAEEENERQMAAWRKTLPGGDPTLLPEKPKSAALEAGEIATYANLIARPNPEKLVVGFKPALVAALLLAERKAGRSLTRREVESIRDQKLAMPMLPAGVQWLRNDRGYDDIDPGNAWGEWQKIRIALLKQVASDR
jgi:hypothetical protein